MMKNCILILALLSAGCGNRMVTENIGEQISQYQIWLDSQVSERVLLLFHSIHYVPLPRRTATRMARYNA